MGSFLSDTLLKSFSSEYVFFSRFKISSAKYLSLFLLSLGRSFQQLNFEWYRQKKIAKFLMRFFTCRSISISQRGEGGWCVRAHLAWPKIVSYFRSFSCLGLCLVIALDVTGSTGQGLQHMRRVTKLLSQVSL
jgi:hypothetical protein